MNRLLLLFSVSFFVASSQLRNVSSLVLPSLHNSRIQQAPLQSTSLMSDPHMEGCERTLVEESCFWKPTWSKSQWQRRIHLDDLKLGQKLKGTVVQELLDGKTGPKLFLEVGAGRTDSRGKWTIVFGMARLSRGKDSVTRKRASRLRTKESIDVWVSRVQKDCGRLEVCLGEEELVNYLAKPKRNVSTLQEGEEVIGKVVRVENYGVVIDVGANRPGLLHILKVRSLYGKYVDGEKGLIDVGLGRGARVRLCVELVKKRRLSLDFTDDVKDEAKAALQSTAAERKTVDLGEKNDMQSQMEISYRSTENVAQGANFAAFGSSGPAFTNDFAPIQGEGEVYEEESNDSGDDDDDYDEDRDIEDSLGLGFY